jgi:hypothetical protein
MLQDYVVLGEQQYIAVTLWTIHTHIFEQFMVTPRLVVDSPTSICGKSVLLDVLNRLAARSEKFEDATAAVIIRVTTEIKGTLLLDEGDNLELKTKATMRTVFNSGYRKGGTIPRTIDGVVRRFSTYAPLALALIKLELPWALMSRSIQIHMHRANIQPSRRFNVDDAEDLDKVHGYLVWWARAVKLNHDPEMPAELGSRQADNWRPLIAIADACSPEWGRLAREAAISLSRGDRVEDVGIMALRHSRTILNTRAIDRIGSKELVRELINSDDAWTEYCGPTGADRSRKLTPGALARLLKRFNIYPHTVWPLHRNAETKAFKGYYRADFELAWRAYLDESVTPSQAPRLRLVAGPKLDEA